MVLGNFLQVLLIVKIAVAGTYAMGIFRQMFFENFASNVFPLFPEAIKRQDSSKNDCELNAAKRLLPAIREDFPKLKILVVEDALAANAPHIQLLEDLSFSYILVAKPSNNAYIF
jgi:hypothetical protein